MFPTDSLNQAESGGGGNRTRVVFPTGARGQAGWTCGCGSGTTALVARKHGRRSIGIELNETYARMAARRCSQLSLLTQDGAA